MVKLDMPLEAIHKQAFKAAEADPLRQRPGQILGNARSAFREPQGRRTSSPRRGAVFRSARSSQASPAELRDPRLEALSSAGSVSSHHREPRLVDSTCICEYAAKPCATIYSMSDVQVVLIIAIAGGGFWFALMFASSVLGGWSTLARSYRGTRCSRVVCGVVNLWPCVTIGVMD